MPLPHLIGRLAMSPCIPRSWTDHTGTFGLLMQKVCLGGVMGCMDLLLPEGKFSFPLLNVSCSVRNSLLVPPPLIGETSTIIK